LSFFYIIITYTAGVSPEAEFLVILSVLAVFFALWFWFPLTHYDGQMIVTSAGDKKLITLELNQDPEEMMKEVSFKVVLGPEE
jgi:hypothetical protein